MGAGGTVSYMKRGGSELQEPAGSEPRPGLDRSRTQVVEVGLPGVPGRRAAQHVAEPVRAVDLAAGHPDGVDELGVDVAAYPTEAAHLAQQRAVDHHRAARHELPIDLAGGAEPDRQ